MPSGAENDLDLFSYSERANAPPDSLEEERRRAAIADEMFDCYQGGSSVPDEVANDDEPELFEPPPHEAFEQMALLDIREPWEEHWVGMPDYQQADCAPWRSIQVHFASKADMIAFSELIGRNLSTRSRSTWYPPVENVIVMNKRWRSDRDDTWEPR